MGDVKAIGGHFLLGDAEKNLQQAYDFVAKVHEMKDNLFVRTESAAGEVQEEDMGGIAENEQAEQDELRKLQTTVQRLEAQLKELRGALRESDKAPLLVGQVPDGYIVNPAPLTALPPEPSRVYVSAATGAQAHGLAPPYIPGAVPDLNQGYQPAPTKSQPGPPGGGVGGF